MHLVPALHLFVNSMPHPISAYESPDKEAEMMTTDMKRLQD